MELPRLIALSPGTLQGENVPAFLERASLAIGAGLPGLLLRESRLSEREWIDLARELRLRCEGIWFAVHDRAHLALHVGADALHLGFRSLQPQAVRGVVGAELPLGLSTHAEDGDELRARWTQADYLFHGPVRATPSKAGLREPIGFEGLERCTGESGRPTFAIGGLRPEDVVPARRAGAHGIAVLGGILGLADPGHVQGATEDYLAAEAAAL